VATDPPVRIRAGRIFRFGFLIPRSPSRKNSAARVSRADGLVDLSVNQLDELGLATLGAFAKLAKGRLPENASRMPPGLPNTPFGQGRKFSGLPLCFLVIGAVVSEVSPMMETPFSNIHILNKPRTVLRQANHAQSSAPSVSS